MTRMLLRSVLFLLAAALVGSLVIFVMLHSLGGDIASIILGNSAKPAALRALRAELGLDRPWIVQYLDWLKGLLQGDLGHSYGAQYDIFAEIRTRLAVTLTLVVTSVVIAAVIALAVGAYSAVHRNDLRGGIVNAVTQFGIAIPTFWVGLLLIMFFSIRLGWLPSAGHVGWAQSPVGAVRSLTLPIVALTIPLAAIFSRYVRSAMIDVLGEDYIRTAMAKGRTLWGAVLFHGVRNASVSLVTVGTLQVGGLIAGAVVIENVFTLPGLGSLLVTALNGREALVVQSTVFVILLIVLVLNFAMDMGYGLLDPRIRDADRRPADG